MFHDITGLQKKLNKLSSKRVAYRQVGKWTKPLVNHLYKTIETTDKYSEKRTEMWKSSVNHVCNIHNHQSEAFPKCLHGELEDTKIDEDGQVWTRDYINPGEFQSSQTIFSLESGILIIYLVIQSGSSE